MRFTKEQLDAHKKDDDSWSEKTVKHFEALAGKPWKEIHDEAYENAPPETPEGNPYNWSTNKKLDFIGTHGRKAYEELLREHIDR